MTEELNKSADRTVLHAKREDRFPEAGKCALLAVIFGAFFVAALFYWWRLDHRYPSWDAANHVMDAIKYARLLEHARPLKGAWWHDFLTVSFNYPMTPHLLSGLTRCLFGFGLLSDCLLSCFYSALLSFSLYKLVLRLGGDSLAAALAVLFINCYPLVTFMSHIQMLDFGCISLVCFAYYCLFNWQKEATLKSAWLASLALALGATSKQGALIFLAAPLLIALISGWLRKTLNFRQVAILGALPLFWLAVWLVPNYAALKAWREYYFSQTGAHENFLLTFCEHFGTYCSAVPAMMSTALFAIFVGSSAFLIWKRAFAPLLPLALAALTGVIGFSCLAMNNPEARYILPILILPAVVCGMALSRVYASGKAGRLVSWAVPIAPLIVFVFCNYTPYPLELSQPLEQLAAVLRADANSAWGPTMERSPIKDGDIWGVEWALRTMTESQHKTPRLNVMPSTDAISVHSLELCALLSKMDAEISTFRQYTLKGDRVEFNEAALDYYDWYLLKSGNQGFEFCDQSSRKNYEHICEIVSQSGKFALTGRKNLPDGSFLSLYRRL